MKKILAVLIAISLVASMAFAADLIFSVDFAAKGNVVKVADLSKADKAVFLNETQDSSAGWYPPMWGGTGYDLNVVAATADGKAGASVVLYEYAGDLYNYSVGLWIKPVDMLTLSFFDADEKLFAEAVSGDSILKFAGDYGVTVAPVEGLTIDVVLAKDATLKSVDAGAKVTFAIDGVATLVANANTDKQYGAGVNGISAGPLASAEAYFIYDDGAMNVYENATVVAGPVKVFEEVKVDGLDSTITVPTYVKVSGKAGDVALACTAQWADVQKAANVAITPSATISGAVGAASWSLGAKVPVTLKDSKATVGFAVPYTVKLSY